MCGLLLLGCDKNDDNSTSPLPALPDPDDVCSGMDDIVFMQYCYDNFDANHDGKVSRQEAKAVYQIMIGATNIDSDNALDIRSLKGIGYFSNLERLKCCGCEQLESADLSNNPKIKMIQDSTFYDCVNLTSVNIPNSVASIGASAFERCFNLTSVNIPDRVTSIERDTFYNCRNLTSIHIPNGVASIGAGAFYGCIKLTSIHLPDKISSIENAVFSWCTDLTSIHIPDRVTSIGNQAFCRCEKLTSITIPDKVSSIGNEAFAGCENLAHIFCRPVVPPKIPTGVWTFPFNSTIYVPRTSVNAYKTAENWALYADQIAGYDF